MFFKKGTKLYSIFNFKCPHCHEGEFFKEKSSFRLKKITEIHESCSECGQKYMLEPSFYYGAMYVAYALSVALAIAVFSIAMLLFQASLLHAFFAITAILILTTPINLRLARIIWINIFVSHKDIKKDSHNAQ